MPRPIPSTLPDIAQAVAAHVRRKGYLSVKPVARGLRLAPRTVERRLPHLLPLLPPDVAAIVAGGVRAPGQKRVSDADVVRALEQVVSSGQPPAAWRVAKLLGCTAKTVRLRLAYLDLPPHLSNALDAFRRRSCGLRPRDPGPRPVRWRGGPWTTRHSDAEVTEAVAQCVANGPFTVAALARRLGMRWESAARRLAAVREQLPDELLFAVAGEGPTQAPPGSQERIEVFARRVYMGLPVNHPQDAGFAAAQGPGCPPPAEELAALDYDGEDEEPRGESRAGQCRPRERHVFRLAR